MDAIAPQPLTRFRRQGGPPGELTIRLVVAGQECQGDILVATQLRQTLDAIGPITLPAEHANDD